MLLFKLLLLLFIIGGIERFGNEGEFFGVGSDLDGAV
jgi:hypothetical protein